MFSFSGTAGPTRKVDLRGKSRGEETREQVLERTRLERERRQRHKLEQGSALCIQSRWRQARTARQYADKLRADWIQQYEKQASQSGTSFEQLVVKGSDCIRTLLRFYDPCKPEDQQRLAKICRAITSSASSGSCSLLAQAAQAAMLAAQATAASSCTAGQATSVSSRAAFTEQQLVLFRLNKLAAACMATLSACSQSYMAELTSPASSLPASQHPAAAFTDFLIRIVNPDTWKASINSNSQLQQFQQAAAAGAAAVLTHLYHQQLFSRLWVLLSVEPPAQPGKTCVEVLVTQLTVRCITLHLVPTQTPPKHAAAVAAARIAAMAAAATAAGTASTAILASATAEQSAEVASVVSTEILRHGVIQLLLVPSLWAKCASLLPVAGRLCALALAELGPQVSSEQLVAVLRQRSPAATAGAPSTVPAGAAAMTALVGNILDACGAGVLAKGPAAEQATQAEQLVRVLLLVLDVQHHLEVLQKRQQKQCRQLIQSQQGASIESPSKANRGPSHAFVPGAGFVSGKSMDVDNSYHAEHMDVDETATNAAAGPAAAPAQNGSSAANTPAVQAGTASNKAEPFQQPVAASAWSGEHSSSEQQGAGGSCLQLLAGTSKGLHLLRQLVTVLLPATNAAETAKQEQQVLEWRQQQHHRPGQEDLANAPAHLSGSGAQQQLCSLLWQLSRPLQYRQKVWLGLSVGARLVPRLWFSYILPLHKSTPGGILASSSKSSNNGGHSSSSSGNLAAAAESGWILPLLVLAQAFNAALSFTHLEDFYADAAPLVPMQQLYSGEAPDAGLAMLIKAAVWQVLWMETPSPHATPQQQQQQQLRRSLGEIGGLLLCQLYDRNCVRQYCPPEVFLATTFMSPDKLQLEVAAAAAKGGVGALGPESDDDEADPSASWQQQQEWQRQRQQQGAGVIVAEEEGGGALQGNHTGSTETVRTTVNGGVVRADSFGFDAEDPVQQLRRTAVFQGAGGGAGAGSRVWLVLQHAPCLIPFQDRVKLFQSVVADAKEAAEYASAMQYHNLMEMLMDTSADRFVTIRREQLLEDGYTQLNKLDSDRLKGRLRIQYVNEAGMAEAGIDGGGLFKDFMEELLKQGFSPQSQLFAENPQHQLYPNPAAYQLVPDAEGHLEFLGRMLGKSLYEGILLELPLAAFFLTKMRGGVCDINDMPALDPEVYKNLLQLRHYKGDFAELSLNFTATVVDPTPASGPGIISSNVPRQQEVELKPGGRDIPVRADNVIEYIHRLADFRLNRQMDRAAGAFLRGFFDLIKPRWVRMFNEAELQMLISGSEEGIDVEDLMEHVNYAGGYHEEHPVIITLWEAMRSFTPQQQRQFLKFVTSCSRAPLLGFAYLEPRLCVQMSGGVLEPSARKRLPTAATCMNLLKLPPYQSLKEMQEKLLYAITAGAGFELS